MIIELSARLYRTVQDPAPALSGLLFTIPCGLAGLTALKVHGQLTDLTVYRAGGQAWLQAQSLYEGSFPLGQPGRSLPFTYPPFAALCFSVLTLAPATVIAAAFSVGSLGALLVAVRITGGFVRPGTGWPAALLISCLVVALEPVWQTLLLGQINLYLMAMVIVDLLAVRCTRRRGMLIGIAAAIKLTPAIFLLYLAAGRQWRQMINAVAAFGAATLLAMLMRPRESWTYWYSALPAPERIGGLDYAGNQSIRGALHRLGWSTSAELICWAAAAGLVLVLGWHVARRWQLAGQPAAAMIAIALVGLLISPVSWSHHWVWLVPALLVLSHLASQQRGSQQRGSQWRVRVLVLVTGLTLVATLIPAHRLLPRDQGRELAWSDWQHLLGNSYLWLGLLLLTVLLALSRTARTTAVGQAATEPLPRPDPSPRP